jgi:hypothetical protein
MLCKIKQKKKKKGLVNYI